MSSMSIDNLFLVRNIYFKTMNAGYGTDIYFDCSIFYVMIHKQITSDFMFAHLLILRLRDAFKKKNYVDREMVPKVGRG